MIGKVIVMPELMKRKRYSTKKEKNEKEEITTMGPVPVSNLNSQFKRDKYKFSAELVVSN